MEAAFGKLVDGLLANGPIGLFLLTLLLGLGFAVRLYLQSNDRLIEYGPSYTKALNENAAASRELAAEIAEQNRTRDVVGGAIATLSGDIRVLSQQIEHEGEANRERMSRDTERMVEGLQRIEKMLERRSA